MRVGDTIKDGSGREWIIARLYKWPKYIDYDLMAKDNGEYGYMRVLI